MSMFGKKQEDAPSFSLNAINNIGQGTVIEGNIRTEGDIRIDGNVIGNVMTKGRLVLGATCLITGDILCVNANIDGKLKGNIQVGDVLKLTKTANIEGNIQTKKLIVEEGAVMQAKITMTNVAITGSNVNSANNTSKA